MALPMSGDNPYADEYSERANSLEDYKVTCIQFVRDISKDYIEWIDYYKLDAEEDSVRRGALPGIMDRADDWISRVARSIKGVDIVMNDAIQKMAEATAGKPFTIDVSVDGLGTYTHAKPGQVDIRVRAKGRKERGVKIGSHSNDSRFRIESTFETSIGEPDAFDASDLVLHMDAGRAKPGDVVSFTVIVGEFDGDIETDRRGVSTIIHMG